jgi:hypothetical protein
VVGCDRRMDLTFCRRAGLRIRRASPSALQVKLPTDRDCAKLGVEGTAALTGLADDLDGVETIVIVALRGLVAGFVGVDTDVVDTDVASFVGLADLCIEDDFVGLLRRERFDRGIAVMREEVGVVEVLGLWVDVSSSLCCFTRFAGCRSAGV